MSFGRDTNIGYPDADDKSVTTVLQSIETLLSESTTAADLGSLISGLEENLELLKDIKLLTERVLGQELAEVI